jgi:NTP pyrophosphatase (non-canonical NTP hydrolase)
MTPPYSIGSYNLSGLSKLIEELGEVQQVAGKIMGLGNMGQHWDGTHLQSRLEDELGDLHAAIAFFTNHNGLDFEAITKRAAEKLALFEQWAANAEGT